MKILIVGLPGSGKTTLAKLLTKKLNAVNINADEVRTEYNDWDFSLEGRIRQSNRMRYLSDGVVKAGKVAVCDFVCPTNETRLNYGPDFLIFMDTIKEGRFEDTNRIFEAPNNANIVVSEYINDFELLATSIVDKYFKSFDYSAPTVQMLGRWQPWHDGHMELFKRAFGKTGQVAIQVRANKENDENNPFNFDEVSQKINERLASENFILNLDYIIQRVPNITNITYGRGVGYAIEEEVLDGTIQNISATKIREQLRKDGKLK